MDFRITGLSPEPFMPFYGLPDAALHARGIRRCLVDNDQGFPDRIEMREARVGETVLLLNHVSQPALTPYRAAHAIYVREGATQRYDAINAIPESMRLRLLSLRGFSEDGMMLDADVVDGSAMEPLIASLFSNAEIATIHVHNARRGCYSGRIDRVR